MRGGRRWLATVAVAMVVCLGGMAAQAGAPIADVTLQSFAQAQPTEKPSMATRVKTWTRAKLDAAKKRWAEDKAKFEGCQAQLLEARKTKRLSLHKQGDFLSACMNKKP
jgi:hypothetical protein